MGAVNAWAESETGKRVMSNYIKGCAAKGATTRSGASVVDLDMMRRDAAILANEIVKTAASYDLAPSVMHDISSIACSEPYQTNDGNFRIDLWFSADLSRESLYYDGEGVTNIIALFNNGYLASNRVYGYWDGHKYTGSENVLRTMPGDNSAYVPSRIVRLPLRFMQSAVNNYNTTIGKRHGTIAILNDIYNETPGVYEPAPW